MKPISIRNLGRTIVSKNQKYVQKSGFWSTKKSKLTDTSHRHIVELGVVSKELSVPDHIDKPLYYYQDSKPGSTLGAPEIKTQEQIHRMRESCKLAANILKSCQNMAIEGITTDEIDRFVHSEVIKKNAYPSPLRYAGFPKSVCTSVNNVACHGIPDDRKLKDGDIINIDITVFLNGYHGDCSKTYLVGNVDEKDKHLVKSNRDCLREAIKLCAPNVQVNVIGELCEAFAKKCGLNVIPSFVGHGIGSYFHGPPEILHFKYDTPMVAMKSGMTFTIEPIFTAGESQEIEIQDDGWTAMTTDGAKTSQFEHTILITDIGAEVLTLPD